MNMHTPTIKTLSRVGLLVAAFQLSGCSFLQIGESEYSCKGMPEGVTCMSARDVYQLTESENFRQRVEGDAALAKAKSEGSKGDLAKLEAESAPLVLTGERFVIPRAARDPVPIRTQAAVMRVWVAPWESDAGDLNVPGYIYTEIEPRRWEIGTPAPRPTPTIRPLESRQEKPAH